MQYLQHSVKDLDFPTVILRFFDDLGLVDHASPSAESKYPYEQCSGSGFRIRDTRCGKYLFRIQGSKRHRIPQHCLRV